MKCIIGLGNPGEEFEKTRHNAGFLALDYLRESWSFPNWKEEKKFDAFVSSSLHDGEKVLLVKPLTYMNLSGKTTRLLLDFYKITPDDIIIIHDDTDIELGKIKIATNSRSAGQRGVQNIIDTLGTQEFKRIRIGVGPKPNLDMEMSDFVLSHFSKEEYRLLAESLLNLNQHLSTVATK